MSTTPSTLPALILADLASQPDDEGRVARALELMQDICDALDACDDWMAFQGAVDELRGELAAEAEWRREAQEEHEYYMRTSSRYREKFEEGAL